MMRSRLIETLIGFEILKRHCAIGAKGLETELERLHGAMDRDLKDATPDYEETYLSEINDEYIEVSDTLPRLQWYSQFLVAYAFFEKSLNDICATAKTERNSPLSLKDLSDQGITRARNYLVKVAGFSGPFETVSWQEVKLLAEVRNAIMHRNGLVDNSPDDPTSLFVRLAARAETGITLEVPGQLEPQINFGEQFLNAAINAYVAVIREIGKCPASGCAETMDFVDSVIANYCDKRTWWGTSPMKD